MKHQRPFSQLFIVSPQRLSFAETSLEKKGVSSLNWVLITGPRLTGGPQMPRVSSHWDT
jgi:hypothetical protein